MKERKRVCVLERVSERKKESVCVCACAHAMCVCACV